MVRAKEFFSKFPIFSIIHNLLSSTSITNTYPLFKDLYRDFIISAEVGEWDIEFSCSIIFDGAKRILL